MGVTLPGWAAQVLDLAGILWVNVDEDKPRAEADAWRVVDRRTAPAAANADTAVRQASQRYEGMSASALDARWERTGGSGHLGAANRATRMAPVVLDATADVITATKVAVLSQASVSAVRMATAMLAGGPFAAGSVTATILATRYAMGRILREAGEGSTRVLQPALAQRVTDPFRRILDSLNPQLAGAGGPSGRFGDPFGSGPGRDPQGMLMARRQGKQDGAGLSPEEQAALDNKKQGLPADQKALKRAEAKKRQEEKFEGKRNVQKRENRKRGK